VETIAAYFGGTINRPFAEPFASLEMIGVSGISDFLTA